MKQSLCIALVFMAFTVKAQEPWKVNQLLAPSLLAEKIQHHSSPVIISVGPGAVILNSVDIGMTSITANYKN